MAYSGIAYCRKLFMALFLFLPAGVPLLVNCQQVKKTVTAARQRISINEGWKFMRSLGKKKNLVNADGEDLSFITVKVADKNGLIVPEANQKVIFTVEGPGEIVATDNGDPANLVSFASKERDAYFGLVLAIVHAKKGKPGTIKISASSPGLKTATVEIKSK